VVTGIVARFHLQNDVQLSVHRCRRALSRTLVG
jgi:hypothetical protein